MTTDKTERQRRIEAVRDLVQLRRPLDTAADALAAFTWDSDELVILTRTDALRLVATYLDDRISAEACQRWAEAVEVRDDIGLPPHDEATLRQFLFEVSSPELTEPWTHQRARHWQDLLAS